MWVHRAGSQRLDRVNWSEAPSGNPRPARTAVRLEQKILKLRLFLARDSPLGECGALAIHRALLAQGEPAPCVRTIGRVLVRHGIGRLRRIRRRPPPPGWYLPNLAAGQAELDGFDFVEGLSLGDGQSFDTLTAISLWGSLSGAWPIFPGSTLFSTQQAIAEHWQAWGLPTYAQFDNDSIFQGSHGHPGHLGRLVHFCLCLGVSVVFTPPREQGFQNKIESFNALWQEKVWQRRHYTSAAQLLDQSQAFIGAHRAKHASRFDAAPPRSTYPRVVPQSPRPAQVVLLRRADATAKLQLFGHDYRLPHTSAHRLLRCDWQPLTSCLTVVALHRRNPSHQPIVLRRQLSINLTPWFSAPR